MSASLLLQCSILPVGNKWFLKKIVIRMYFSTVIKFSFSGIVCCLRRPVCPVIPVSSSTSYSLAGWCAPSSLECVNSASLQTALRYPPGVLILDKPHWTSEVAERERMRGGEDGLKTKLKSDYIPSFFHSSWARDLFRSEIAFIKYGISHFLLSVLRSTKFFVLLNWLWREFCYLQNDKVSVMWSVNLSLTFLL